MGVDRCNPWPGASSRPMARSSTGPAARMPALAGSAAAALCLALAASHPTLAQDTDIATVGTLPAYVLGPQDQLELRVADFTTADELRAWDAVNGTYTVGMDGSLTVPFAGSVRAAGRTPADVGALIARGIENALGLPAEPAVSLAIAQYRPIFVSGGVRDPGAYPFQPGLTVAKAVALAGGLPRGTNGSGAGRDLINARGDLDVFGAERDRLQATRARLEAEIAGRESVSLPPDLEDTEATRALIENENAFMLARRDRLRRQLKANADLQDLLAAEIEALSQRQVAAEETRTFGQVEVERFEALEAKGLIRSERQRDARRELMEVEGKLLDVQTALLRARQALNQAEGDAVALATERAATLAAEKQDVDGRIEALAFREQTRRLLIGEALAEGASAVATAIERPAYRIARRGSDGVSQTVEVDGSTDVLPGDVVEIVLVPAEGL